MPIAHDNAYNILCTLLHNTTLFIFSQRIIAMIINCSVEHETDLSSKRASGRLTRSVEVR